MWLVIAELAFDGILAPFAIATLILCSAKLVVEDRYNDVAPALAIVAAVCLAGILALGWPISWTFHARTKIMVSALIGLALGTAFKSRGARIGPITSLGLVGIIIWIGKPALQQGHWEGVLLVTGLIAITLIPSRLRQPDSQSYAPKLLIAIIFTFGLAALAALAKSLSYSVLALALMTSMLGILAIWRSPLASPALVTINATMLALVSALLLYTDVSLPALLILCTIFAAERLAYFAWRREGLPPRQLVLSFCIAPVFFAIVIARIDAGAISIY